MGRKNKKDAQPWLQEDTFEIPILVQMKEMKNHKRTEKGGKMTGEERNRTRNIKRIWEISPDKRAEH